MVKTKIMGRRFFNKGVFLRVLPFVACGLGGITPDISHPLSYATKNAIPCGILHNIGWALLFSGIFIALIYRPVRLVLKK